MTRGSRLAFALLALSAAGPAPGQDGPVLARPMGAPVRPNFGSFSFSTTFSSGGQLTEAHLGIGHLFAPPFSLEVEAAAGAVSYPLLGGGHRSTFSIGPDVLARWRFLRGEAGSLFADAGPGIRVFGSAFPDGGTRFDFTLEGGLGGALRLSDRFELAGGLRLFHVSNAALWGVKRNPGYNSAQVRLGLQYGL